MPLEKLEKYEILERLGQGFVYKARDTESGEIVTIKVHPAWMRTDQELLARFEREIKVEQSIQHPNLAAFREVNAGRVSDPELVGSASDDSGQATVIYLVREYVDGEDLRSIISRGPLSPDRVQEIATQVAKGLGALHENGVIHRDVKPENIRVTSSGDVKLLDFGLVKIIQDESKAGGFKTGVGQLLGTAPYLAPEQVEGKEVDARTDLFALGVLLYEMLSGEMPFPHDNLLGYFHAIQEEQPKPLSQVRSDVPAELEEIVNRLLSKKPDDRYQSTTQVIEALSAVG